MRDTLIRIKRAVLAGRYAFSEKARTEMEVDRLTESDVAESIINAVAIYKRLRLRSPLRDLVAIFIDGIEFKGHLLVVALGLDKAGRKHVLGLRQGATENATVCVGLLEDMVRRGLHTGRDYLFVLDGSKALRSAVAKMFGADVAVQRCQQHKRRNVLKHLPEKHQLSVDARISAAYKMADYGEARKSLDLTVRYLQKLNRTYLHHKT